jgi:hypothetical protein
LGAVVIAKSCIDVIEREGVYHIEGILDAGAEPGAKVLQLIRILETMN